MTELKKINGKYYRTETIEDDIDYIIEYELINDKYVESKRLSVKEFISNKDFFDSNYHKIYTDLIEGLEINVYLY